jgi:hypothetical protein
MSLTRIYCEGGCGFPIAFCQCKEQASSGNSDLLAAPCLLCGYNGSEYWQSGSHEKRCPWHTIGGAAEREQKMLKMIPRALLKTYGC